LQQTKRRFGAGMIALLVILSVREIASRAAGAFGIDIILCAVATEYDGRRVKNTPGGNCEACRAVTAIGDARTRKTRLAMQRKSLSERHSRTGQGGLIKTGADLRAAQPKAKLERVPTTANGRFLANYPPCRVDLP